MTTTRAASTAARSARGWAECAVHVKIFPRPANLAESKEVLRVLQQYGEVVMYRNLKYEAPSPTLNAALAIYRTQNSAYNVVQASPIHFQLQQGRDGWISKISRDASAEGSLPRSTTPGTDLDLNNPQHGVPTGPGDLDEKFGSEELEEDSHFQPNYPHEDHPTVDSNTLMGPGDRWDSKLFAKAMQREDNPYMSTEEVSTRIDSSEAGSPEASSHDTTKRSNKKSAQQLAQQLLAGVKSSSSSSKTKRDQPTSTPTQEFQLTVVKSFFNHQAYIERQAYYAGFNPDTKTIMAEDLKDRVPLEGFLDCNLQKGDVPLRIRLKKKESNRSRASLKELWETGKLERGER
ncbi:MAG: hypothetical protein Q9168_001808 [Polycauliona sp. 1 TL-2023]